MTDEDEQDDTNARIVDNKFCTSCGESIHVDAVMCPDCGNMQPDDSSSDAHMNQTGGQSMNMMLEYDYQKMASKDKAMAIILGFLLGPLGYAYVGKWGLAVVNALTLNYFMFGVIIVPLHTWYMIEQSERELERLEAGR